MKSAPRSAILSLAVAATVLTSLPASADGRWRRDDRRGSDNLVVAGIVGIAAGALAAGLLSDHARQAPPPADAYDAPPPRPVRLYRAAPPVGEGYDRRDAYDADEDLGPAPEPWSRAWYRACAERYRSFDPETGTYFSNGRRRFCTAD